MKRKTVFRLISLIMLLIAVVFVAIALSNPTLGTVFYIGSIRIGSDVWRAFYLLYCVVMTGFFASSFFIK